MGVVAVKEEIYDTVLDGSSAPEGTQSYFMDIHIQEFRLQSLQV